MNRMHDRSTLIRAHNYVAAAADLMDRVQRPREGLKLGRLMQRMAFEGGVDMDPLTRYDKADAEWERTDENAKALPECLRGPGMLSYFHGRDRRIVDYEWLRQERAMSTGPGGRIVDYEWLRQERAMSTGPGGKGGYVVGVDTLAVDPLWQPPLVDLVGVQQIEGFTSNATIARGTGAVTVSWQAGDGTSVSAADGALGAVSVSPKTCIGTIDCTEQLIRQAPAAVDYLGRLLVRSSDQAVDQAILQGSGTSGQPQGLANLATSTGLQQVSGAALAWSGVLNAQRLAAASGVAGARVAWVGAPTVRETLAQRERIATSGRFIWDDGRIAGEPAFVTPDAPASTLFCGDWSQCLLVTFGNGVELQMDRSGTRFNQGIVTFRLLRMVDVAFLQPSAFVRIASIS